MPLGGFGQFRPRTPRPEAEDAAPPPKPDGPTRPLLVVGLGNPTNDYGQTRHNVGMWVIGELTNRYRVALSRSGNVEAARLDIDGLSLIHISEPTRPY